MSSMWSHEISVLIGTRLIVTSPNAMSSRSLASGRSTTAATPSAAARTTYAPGRQWTPNNSRPDAARRKAGSRLQLATARSTVGAAGSGRVATDRP